MAVTWAPLLVHRSAHPRASNAPPPSALLRTSARSSSPGNRHGTRAARPDICRMISVSYSVQRAARRWYLLVQSCAHASLRQLLRVEQPVVAERVHAAHLHERGRETFEGGLQERRDIRISRWTLQQFYIGAHSFSMTVRGDSRREDVRKNSCMKRAGRMITSVISP